MNKLMNGKERLVRHRGSQQTDSKQEKFGLAQIKFYLGMVVTILT
jgi:hypothetical protein